MNLKQKPVKTQNPLRADFTWVQFDFIIIIYLLKKQDIPILFH